MSQQLPHLPLPEALRPPPGWRTDRALLSAYSAEPAVLVTLLLALAGRDDDSGSGGRVALAQTLLDLRGRVAFLLQRGRLEGPRRGRAPQALAPLDRFVREVPWDESDARGVPGRSWHAKLALVRMVPAGDEGGDAHWRLWLGSRNFTRDTSWDICLALDTFLSGAARGQTLPGVEEAAMRLSEQAGEESAWRPLLPELAAAKWNVPRGLDVRRIALTLPDDPGRDLPDEPPGVSRLVAVAPFLDGETVRRLGAWKGRTRTLLSSLPELRRLSSQAARPLDGFDELLDLPHASEEGEASPEEEAAASTDAALDAGARGLHAKLLWAEHGGSATLWLGSPNLTQRAWRRNAEAFAEVLVRSHGGAAAQSLREGIEAFRQMARPVDRGCLEGPESNDPLQEILEALRKAQNQVAARLDGRQVRGADGAVTVRTPARLPHPDDRRVSLAIGRLGGEPVPWPRGAAEVALPETGGVADTDLVAVRVSLESESRTWTQLVPSDPPRPESRDASLLRGYLGPRGFLSWIHAALTLDDTAEFGGGAWDAAAAPLPSSSSRGDRAGLDLPTVEQVLRAWMREPGRLDDVDRILGVEETAAPEDDDEEARAHLKAFSRSWKVLRAELAGGRT